MVSSKAFLLLAVLCVGLASCLVAGCGDRRQSFYPSLADADKAEASARSWIPNDLLPGSSRAIHEVHEISPSTEWCAFEFLQLTRKAFEKISRVLMRYRHR